MNDDMRRGSVLGSNEVDDASLALDRSLEEASASLESVRILLSLRKTVGRNLRAAVRCLLAAQEKIEVEGPSTAARLDLLEAIRLIGSVEQEMKGDAANATPAPATRPVREPSPAPEPDTLPEGVFDIETDPKNRRAYYRVPAHVQIQLEPEHRAHRQDLAAMPLNGMTVNLSRGGMLAKLDQGILRHGRYLIRFLETSGAIQPSVAWGAVRRSRARNRGWEVGIEFDDPLEIVK